MRTEDWHKDFEGMLSTVVVDVRADETVAVSDQFVDELGLSRVDGVDTTDALRGRFSWVFPYDIVAAALEQDGWQHASTS
jgi:hypothetical protein